MGRVATAWDQSLLPQGARRVTGPTSSRGRTPNDATALPAGKCRTENPLLPRLANSLQIDHRSQSDQSILPAKPLTHRERTPRPAKHSAQDPGSDVADLAAMRAF